jgi:hypothetical protein
MPYERNINFYNHIPEKYKRPPATYANYERYQLELPLRVVIAGSSGTMKSNATLNIIQRMNCFDNFYLFVASKDEPLYAFLIDYVTARYGKKAMHVSDDINSIPHVSEINAGKNNLFIIDDLINEKVKNPNILNLFTNGRKSNASIIYVTQDFFKLNNTVRKNCKLIVLTRFNDEKDLDNILSKYKQRLPMQGIRNLYNYATGQDQSDFFAIDTEGKPQNRYRVNLDPIG